MAKHKTLSFLWSLSAIFYQFSELFYGKKNTRLYRRYGPPKDVRDFLVAELLVDSQLENRFLFWRQSLQQPMELFALFKVFKLVLRGSLYAAGVFVYRDEVLRAFLHVINAMIQSNLTQPGF